MNIQVSDARGLFTKKLVNQLDIQGDPTLFLKSFFKNKFSTSKEVGIEVRRNSEPIAVDVIRGASNGNLNRDNKSTEKIWIPPFYDEKFFLNELDGYDRLFGQHNEVDMDVVVNLIGLASQEVMKLQNKINRTYELAAAQVLQTGILQLNSGDNIDFRRQAASKGVLGAGNWWTETAVNPNDTLEAGAKFIRQQGMAAGETFNVIFGAKAWAAYVNNPKIQNLADNRRFSLADVVSPIPFGLGSDFLGRVSAGTYNFNCWGYQRFYNPTGTDKTGKVPYIDDEQVIILPNDVVMDFGYGAVPHLKRDRARAEFPEFITMESGEFFIDNYMDNENVNHVFRVKSAGMPIPTQIDAIYSSTVVDPS